MPDPLTGRIAVVGAGHAGGTFALALRAGGWTGAIDLIGDEDVAPYQRPPLSKAWLQGKAALGDLLLRPAQAYAAANINLRLSTKVAALDADALALTFADGTRADFDHVVLATGARPRMPPIPGIDAPQVFSLRGIGDADGLRTACVAGHRLAVLGGGYIGLEVASAARAAGAAVTVIEMAPRLLARTASPPLAGYIRTLHEANGVEFVLGRRAEAILPGAVGVESVALDDGTVVECDSVLVGVGAEPNVELARAAGIACGSGILVDDVARTSAPRVFALGDCSERPISGATDRIRLESVPSALEQSRRLVALLISAPLPGHEVPWFWSDQYHHKLQVAGLVAKAATSVERVGSGSSRTIVHLTADGRVCAIEALDAPGDFMAGRRAIGARIRPSIDALADPDISLKHALA